MQAFFVQDAKRGLHALPRFQENLPSRCSAAAGGAFLLSLTPGTKKGAPSGAPSYNADADGKDACQLTRRTPMSLSFQYVF